MNRDRQFRRRQLALKKRRIAGHYNAYWWDSPRKRGAMAHTPAACSCPMCGNPRRYLKEKLTRQELKADKPTE